MSPESPQVAAKKKALRLELKRALRAIPDPIRWRDERTVVKHLTEFLCAEQRRHPALRIALYASRKDEFSTVALDDWLARQSIARAIPMITGDTLRFVEVGQQERIHDFPEDRFGIPTPPASRVEVDLSTCHGVIVPGLGFDRTGGRIGYGRGFYDKCLAQLRQQRANPWRMAIHFDVQLVNEIPMSHGDERVDWLCSPALGLYPCAPRVAGAAR